VMRTLPRNSSGFERAPVGAASNLTAIESARLSRQLTPPAMRHPGFLPAHPTPASRFDEAPQSAASGSPAAIAFSEMRIV